MSQKKLALEQAVADAEAQLEALRQKKAGLLSKVGAAAPTDEVRAALMECAVDQEILGARVAESLKALRAHLEKMVDEELAQLPDLERDYGARLKAAWTEAARLVEAGCAILRNLGPPAAALVSAVDRETEKFGEDLRLLWAAGRLEAESGPEPQDLHGESSNLRYLKVVSQDRGARARMVNGRLDKSLAKIRKN